MKKWIVVLSIFMLGAGVTQAALEGNVYHGAADDGDFNNAANWWNPVTTNDELYFRGDTIDLFPARANIALSAPATVVSMVFQGTIIPGAAYTISGSTLTLDDTESRTTLIDVQSPVTVNQTIASDLVINTVNDANNIHIITRNGASGGLILSGNISQAASSQGVGIFPGTSDIEISGNVDGSSKDWKVRDATGAGVLKLTGAGSWTGTGTLQVDMNTEILMNRIAADSSGFGSGAGMILQLVGGNLIMGNNEQLDVVQNVAFNAASAGTFKLDGHKETMGGLLFGTVAQSGALDMGIGGELHLISQSSTATWGALMIQNWDVGSDHIYVDGGSFSPAQLAAITFDGWEPAGAKLESGELFPTGTSDTAYETWAFDFGVGAETNDYDKDGLLNVYEYGLGGDPTNAADQGISPVYSTGAGLLTYIYPQLSDPGHGLDYHLELSDGLVIGVWTNSGYTVTGTNIVVGDFDYVTNTVPTAVKSTQFVKLFIDTL